MTVISLVAAVWLGGCSPSAPKGSGDGGTQGREASVTPEATATPDAPAAGREAGTPAPDARRADSRIAVDSRPPAPDSAPACGTCPSGFTCSASGVCKTAAGVPQLKHVFVIYMENHSYSSIIGNLTSAPYENQIANQYVLLTSYFDVAHPSLPNYLALVAGDTFGVSSDCSPTGFFGCPQTAATLADELGKVGKTWHAYAENMESNCETSTSADGLYAPKHNPFVYFTPLAASCATNDVPYGTNGANFTADMAKGGFDYVSITPNLCDDTHDSCSSDDILQGDTWLMNNVPRVTGSSEWKDGGVLFIVWDEGECGGDQIVNIVLSPLAKPATKSATMYDHYSMLATIQDGLGVPRLANTAGAQPITDIWK